MEEILVERLRMIAYMFYMNEHMKENEKYRDNGKITKTYLSFKLRSQTNCEFSKSNI